MPNITGYAQYSYNGYASSGEFDGVLYAYPSDKHPGATNGTNISNGRPGFAIDSSRCSSIYKTIETVQVDSLIALTIVRI